LGCHPVAVHIYTQEQHRTTQLTNDNTQKKKITSEQHKYRLMWKMEEWK